MAQKKSSWNQVTPFSKFLAMFLFILLPFVGFYLGVQYERMVTPSYQVIEDNPPASIGTNGKIEGSVCGGMDGKLCPDGYTCRLHKAEANAIGSCIEDNGMQTGSSAGYVSL